MTAWNGIKARLEAIPRLSLAQAGEYGRFVTAVFLRAVGTAVSLLSAVVTARGLGLGGRGLFYACTSAAQVTAQVLALGMPSATVLAVASRPALGRSGAGRALRAATFAGLIAFLAARLMEWSGAGRWLDPAVIELSPVVAGLAGAQVLLWWCSSLTQALGATDRLPVIELLYRLLSVSWAWVALFPLELTFVRFLTSLFILDAVSGLLWLGYVRALAPPSAEKPEWPADWGRWSIRAYLPLLLGSGMRRVDALLVAAIGGLRATGLYSIAVQVMDVSQIAPIFLGQKALFAFSAGHGDNAVMRRLRRLLPVCILLMMIAAGVTGNFWAPLLFGPDFAGVGPALLALAIGAAALGWESVAVQEVNAAGYPLALSLGWALTFLVMILLMTQTVPALGVVGAGISLSGAYLLLAAFMYVLRAQVRRAGAAAGRSAQET